MTVTASHPPRLLPWVAGFARWALAVVLALWLLLVLAWGGLHGWIVPRIDQWRGPLEQQARQALGVPVRIGALRAHSDGVFPTLELSDVTLLDAQGRTALHLARVVLALSPRSLWRLGVEQLYIDAPDLYAERDAQGRITVAGMVLDGDPSSDQDAADWLFAQAEVAVRGGRLHWRDAAVAGPPLQLSAVNLVLRNRGRQHQWRLDAQLPPDWGGALTLQGQFRQPLLAAQSGDWQRWTGQAFAQLDDVQVAKLSAYLEPLWAPWLAAPPPNAAAPTSSTAPTPPLRLHQGQGALRLWLDLRQGQPVGAVADVALADWQASVGTQQQPLALRRLSGRLGAQQLDGGGWEVFANNLHAVLAGKAGDLGDTGNAANLTAAPPPAAFAQPTGDVVWPASDWRLRYTPGPQPTHTATMELYADRLDLAALATIAGRLPLHAPWQRTLADYAPQGRVHELAAQWRSPPPPAHPPAHMGQPGAPSGNTGSAGGSSTHIAPAWALPSQYQVRLKLNNLAFGQQPTALLGLRGAQVELNLSQSGGQARLHIQDGVLHLPEVFEQAQIDLQQLSTQVHWQLQGQGAQQQIRVQTEGLRFANADAQGQAQLSWHTADPTRSPARARFPGVLALSGNLSRADGTQVHRYLPLAVPAQARHYVRDAVRSGHASQVQFRVEGDLFDFPFAAAPSTEARAGAGTKAAKTTKTTATKAATTKTATGASTGKFHIAAQVRDVTFDYLPPALRSAGDKPWPVLDKLAGELVFEGASMTVRQAQGEIHGMPQLQLSQVHAQIDDLEHPVVQVSGQIQGPLADMLTQVRQSQLAVLTDGALHQARASGPAQLALSLHLPIDALAQSQVHGRVTFAGNSLRFVPQAPQVTALQGGVAFHERGFALEDVQGQTLGGPVHLSGGMVLPADGAAPALAHSPVRIHAQGHASAQGLRQASELGLLAKLAAHAQGSADYTLTLGLRRGLPELQVHTNLQGMAVHAPAPLGKPAASTLPVRVANRLTDAAVASAQAPLQERWLVDVGQQLRLHYLHGLDSPQASPKVLAGAIAVGAPAAWPQASGSTDKADSEPPLLALPPHGVQAEVDLPELDVDAWRQWWEAAQAGLEAHAPPATSANTDTAATAIATADAQTLPTYLPQQFAVQLGSATVQGRRVQQVQLQVQRSALGWHAQVAADALAGQFDYDPGSPNAPQGRLHARLERLRLPLGAAATASQPTPQFGKANDEAALNRLLDTSAASQASRLPALDVVVQALELQGHALGRLEVLADNHTHTTTLDAPPEWRLRRLNLSTPEATLTSHGNWTLLRPSAAAGTEAGAAQRRTLLNVELNIHDAGQLLGRLGMAGVLHKGQGQIQGQVGWLGTPLLPDYRSMTGTLHLAMQDGQFLQADPGLAKLLGVLSLQSLPRRLSLDFRDVFSAGFAFDFVRGDVHIDQGVAHTNNLQMKGVQAAVLMEGSADIHRETQQLHVLVVPEINAMTASLLASAINPVVGLGSLLAQAVLRGPLSQATTREFRIEGTWADPQVERVARPLLPTLPSLPSFPTLPSLPKLLGSGSSAAPAPDASTPPTPQPPPTP